ncbi:hypothetical protein HID58_013548, partial [Brassica napus]
RQCLSPTHPHTTLLSSLTFPPHFPAKMTRSHLCLLCLLLSLVNLAASQDDATIMQSLKSTLHLTPDVDWSNPDPCKWVAVQCDGSNRVTRIQLKQKGISGTLPLDLQKLSELIVLEFFSNKISGPVPDLSGLTHLQRLNLHDNLFDSTPKNLFSGMNSLQEAYLDNNPFASWEIPETVKEATSLKNLSLVNCNLTANAFSGPIPDLSGLQSLRLFNLRENQLTGLVPPSFTGLKSLTVVNLTNNCFQGPTPLFKNSLTSLETINLSNNQLTGSIPTELTSLPRLRTLDVSNNDIHGDVPKFRASVSVVTTGNVNIGRVSPTSWKSFRNRI